MKQIENGQEEQKNGSNRTENNKNSAGSREIYGAGNERRRHRYGRICAASLETKGYLIRKPNPWDGRSQLLYATEKAETLKNSKAEIETVFYEWLLLELPEKEAESFCETLDKLYWKSKRERQNHFAELSKILSEKADKTIKATAEGGSSDEG